MIRRQGMCTRLECGVRMCRVGKLTLQWASGANHTLRSSFSILFQKSSASHIRFPRLTSLVSAMVRCRPGPQPAPIKCDPQYPHHSSSRPQRHPHPYTCAAVLPSLPSSLSLWFSPLASLAAPSRTHTHAYHSRIPLTPHNHHPRSPPHTTPPQSRTEFLSLSGLRVDGRRPPEPRKVRCAFGVLPVADGSACFEQGNTKVLVTVRGPREVRRRADALHDRAILDCSFSLAPFAKVRHAKKRYTDRNALETQIAIKQVG